MGNSSSSGSTGKQVCISLRGLSHEVCVAATRAEYWRQLVQNSSISIRGTGNYVPVKLESMCNDEDEARLQLIINSQAEQDNQQIDDIYNQIRSDLKLFEHNDAPVYNYADRKVTVFGSLFNSLPMDIFNPDLHILGREYCNITKIKKSLACSIIVESLTGTMVDSFMAYRYRFIIHNEKRTTLDFAVMQIQALVHQAQHSYFMMYSIKIGRMLGIIKQMETGTSTSNQEEYSSSTAYKPTCKRKRTEDEEQQLTISQSIYDSDQTDDDDDDEIILDHIREQQRQAAQRLLNRICARMQARARKDTLEEAHEDPTTIKSYFRTTSSTKATTNDSECAIHLVEHEINLDKYGIKGYKCTLIFNKILKVGAGTRDRLKKNAKLLAYEELKTNIEFLTKPFYNGKKHQITGTLYGPDKKDFCKIDGEWNGIMYAKYSDTKISDIFFDTKTTPVIKKTVRPIAEQDEFESRRLWKDVTFYLKSKLLDKATESKSLLEQRQREGAKERAEKSIKWQTKYFIESGEQKWTYQNKLNKRLKQQS
ncbi:unnamed protein product [Rotaria sp. Silwood1]|nr:unnamed protein product [Rotaria sp. Silwood1]